MVEVRSLKLLLFVRDSTLNVLVCLEFKPWLRSQELTQCSCMKHFTQPCSLSLYLLCEHLHFLNELIRHFSTPSFFQLFKWTVFLLQCKIQFSNSLIISSSFKPKEISRSSWCFDIWSNYQWHRFLRLRRYITLMNLFNHIFKHLEVCKKYSAMYTLYLLTFFSVFGNVVKSGISCLIYYILTYKLTEAIIFAFKYKRLGFRWSAYYISISSNYALAGL